MLRGLLASGAGVAAGCSEQSAGEMSETPRPYLDGTLEILLTPSAPPEDKRQWYGPIRDYLGNELGIETTLSFSDTYAAVIDELGSGTADIADLGPLAAALGVRSEKLSIAVQRKGFGNWTYGSVLVTRSDSDVSTVADLQGRHVAFADRLSTSGTLMPLYMLQQAGLDIGAYPMQTDSEAADFEASFTGHQEAWTNLRSGDAAAAGVGKFVTYDRAAGRVKQGFAYLDQYQNLPDPPLVTSARLTDTDASELVDALVDAPKQVFYGADETRDTDDDPWFTDVREASAVRYQSVIDAAEAVGVKRALLRTS